MKNALVIINPHAGRMKLMRDLTAIDSTLFEGGYECEFYFTKSRGDAARKAKECAGKYDLIVCGGGDGTYNEMISGILDSGVDVLLGYIPAGTTNDFASTLAIPVNHIEAAKNIAVGKPRTIDVGKFGDRHFSYIASFGAFTSSSYTAPQEVKNVIGHAAYILEGIKDIQSIKPYHTKISFNGEEYEEDFIFGAICNSTSIAGIIKLDEKLVDMNDGQFEVFLIRMPEVITVVPKILNSIINKDFSDEHIIFKKASEVSVYTPGKLNWSLDGEYAESTGEITLKNIKGAVSLIL